VTEVRGGVKEGLALVKSLADELVLLVVELEDGLLKIADSTVNELGRLRGGSC
jgi:hypothetical protein